MDRMQPTRARHLLRLGFYLRGGHQRPCKSARVYTTQGPGTHTIGNAQNHRPVSPRVDKGGVL